MRKYTSAAACDKHLPNHLRELVDKDKTATAIVSRLETPNSSYTCSCGVPAHWFVRLGAPWENLRSAAKGVSDTWLNYTGSKKGSMPATMHDIGEAVAELTDATERLPHRSNV